MQELVASTQAKDLFIYSCTCLFNNDLVCLRQVLQIWGETGNSPDLTLHSVKAEGVESIIKQLSWSPVSNTSPEEGTRDFFSSGLTMTSHAKGSSQTRWCLGIFFTLFSSSPVHFGGWVFLFRFSGCLAGPPLSPESKYLF